MKLGEILLSSMNTIIGSFHFTCMQAPVPFSLGLFH